MNLWQKTKLVFQDKQLRKRLAFVLFAIVIFRLLASVPIPGVDNLRLQSLLESNQFLGLLNIFSGGGLSALSIVMLGIGPYITASIVMQLLTVMSPRLKSLYHEEGEAGRMKFSQYSRFLTVPMAVIQGFSFITLLISQGVVDPLGAFDKAVAVIIVTAGALLLMWLGELMTEGGIGNGVSFLIFAGIVAGLPGQVKQLVFTYDQTQLLTYVGFILVGIVVIAGIVLVTEAERLIPITHSRQGAGGRLSSGGGSYLPLRLNQAGVMPVIFALSIMTFPQILTNLFINSSSTFLQNLATAFNWFQNSTWVYAIVYFVLVFAFTYFYTAITFEPKTVAENLQKNGAFIPGIRPGKSTEEYIAKLVSRITLMGGIFLGVIAVLPIIMRQITGAASLAIGGTAILIVVAVVLDILKKLDGQISMRQY